jgi:hypothetical protein
MIEIVLMVMSLIRKRALIFINDILKYLGNTIHIVIEQIIFRDGDKENIN